MAKRRPPEHKQMMPERKEHAPEPLAADRQNERQDYSQNNFAFGTAAALIILVVLIIVLYVTGVFKP
jgi:hypothetical protein